MEANMAPSSKVHVFEDVAKHRNTGDCWLILFGKVYDLTSFIEEHPGGPEVILAATAKDATNDFIDVGHSDSAKQLMEKYCIGEIDASTIPSKLNYTSSNPKYNPDKTFTFVMRILQFLAPLIFLGLALAARAYSKKE